jgi:plasmid stabilization system protein ParE
VPRAYTVIIAPEAAAEVAVIAIWWNKHRPAAPRLFQIELDRALLRLTERPEVAPKVRMRGRAGVHALVLQRSGYLVFYQLDVSSKDVIVVRVRRGHRQPLHRR